MTKKILIIVLSLIMSNNSFAQNNAFECIYEATSIIPTSVQEMPDDNIKRAVIAQLSQNIKTYTLLYSEGKYLFYENSKSNTASVGGITSIYREQNSNTSISQENILDKKFIIKENIPSFEWEIHSEATNINGRNCIKATLKDNNSIVAWFTGDIPIAIGPLGYYGLPGIIVRLETATKKYELSAITKKENVEIIPPTEGKVISREEFTQIKNQKMKEYGGNSSGGVRIIRM